MNSQGEMGKHAEVKRYKFMHSGDCYLYKIHCSCGKDFGGWTPDEVENCFIKHKRSELPNE